MSTVIRSIVALIVSALVAALVIVLGVATPAHADPVTVTDPGGSGASVTLSSGTISPGERITISGSGFTPVQGSNGDPLVAVRPYDNDAGPGWTIGGADAYYPSTSVPPGSEAAYWFKTDHATGTFTGFIQAPSSMTANGPIGTGRHWLRILSGAFFTSTGDRLTTPITFEVPLAFEAGLTTGLTGPTAVFQEGTHFRPGAQVTVRGRGFEPATAVTATLDGTAVGLAEPVETDADGRLPANARVLLPVGTTVGPHELRLTTGSFSRTMPITVTPPPTASVPTTVVRPGGTIAYELSDYIGVSGQQQKVAVVVAEQVLACIQTDANGDATGTVALPADLGESVLVRFNVGLSCVLPPAGVVNDQPVGSIPHTLTVSATAPVIALAVPAHAGRPVAVTGSGFAAGGSVAITVGGTAVGTLTADATGAVSGTVTLPAGVGERTVLATDGTRTAAASVTVVAAPAPPARTGATVALGLAKKRIKKGKRSTAVVTVTGGATAATGTVEVYVDARLVGTATLDGAGSAPVPLGKVKAKRGKKGKKATRRTVRVVYSGDTRLDPAETQAVVRAKGR